MDEYECMSLCVSIWHMHTSCAVFVCYAQAHVTSTELVADVCACLCVIVAKVLCMKPVLFIEITAPCVAYCVCEGCERSSYLSSQHHSRVFIRCHSCSPNRPSRLRCLSIKMNTKHNSLCFLKTYRQDILSLLLWHTVELILWGSPAPDIYQQCCSLLLSHLLSLPQLSYTI